VPSVLASNCSDIELILIDDMSDQKGFSDIPEYISSIPNIIYKRLTKNNGPGVARNHGIQMAKGEWLFFLDNDDIIYSDVLPELLSILKHENETDVLFFKTVNFHYPDGHIELQTFDIPLSGHLPLCDLILDITLLSLWNFCFRRAFINEKRIRCSNTFYNEDNGFTLLALSNANKISPIPFTFYEYRLNMAESLSSTDKPDLICRGRMLGRIKFYTGIREILNTEIPYDRKISIKELLAKCILFTPPPSRMIFY
jgi:glycosyltransferase involved in cell wall biosynthesis